MNLAIALRCPGSANLEGMASPAQNRRHEPEEDAQDPPAGPFRASQVREGDPYELSNGHPIRCMGAGERHGLSNTRGAMVIGTDPELLEGAGVDVAFEFNGGKNLRAPDISAGNLKDKPGWAKGVPPLAIEYADRGQDEASLQQKIKELLAAGTQYIWVVRLQGPLRVEVHRPGKRKTVVGAAKELTAPGVLKNPVPVRSLVDRAAANRATLRNLLNQLGYQDLDAVRAEGRHEGLKEGLEESRQAGLKEGQAEGLREAVYTACALLAIPVSASRRALVERMDVAKLQSLCDHLKRSRTWPPRPRSR